MTIHELYRSLQKAYTLENLNEISAFLINLNKNRNYLKIREIVNLVSSDDICFNKAESRAFHKLIMLYHPDRLDYTRNQIEILYSGNDYDGLKKYSHILKINISDYNLDEIIFTESSEIKEYFNDYLYDIKFEDGYSVFEELDEEESYDLNPQNDIDSTFYNLIKIREYGRIDIELPAYYLEDFEEFEMTDSKLESLDGIEHCIHVKILDLSNNEIFDLSYLMNLKYLEEVYLSNNEICFIDSLSMLENLRMIDLSGNRIEDLSPLFSLEKLEYVDLTNNPVSFEDVYSLRKKGIVVLSD